MNLRQQLYYLFNPRSVAVIGASNVFGKWGFNILGRVLSSKGDRQIYAINNKDPEVLGLKAYKTLIDVPGPVDLAVITVPFQALHEAMQDCVQKGVKIAIVISSGLAETGDEGARWSRKWWKSPGKVVCASWVQIAWETSPLSPISIPCLSCPR